MDGDDTIPEQVDKVIASLTPHVRYLHKLIMLG
jgi:hypothetical protein